MKVAIFVLALTLLAAVVGGIIFSYHYGPEIRNMPLTSGDEWGAMRTTMGTHEGTIYFMLYPANFNQIIIDVRNPIKVVYDPSQTDDVLISSTSRPIRAGFGSALFKLKNLEIRVRTEELKKEWERRINMLIRKQSSDEPLTKWPEKE